MRKQVNTTSKKKKEKKANNQQKSGKIFIENELMITK
jgi:hypothetical protein